MDSAEGHSQKLFCILFFLKIRDRLNNVQHPMVKDIVTILNGETLKGYRSLYDIADRMEIYSIEL